MEKIDKNYFKKVEDELFCVSAGFANNQKTSFLFDSFEVMNLNFKNRFCLINYADSLFNEQGTINNNFFEFFNKIASSGVGLICSSGLDVLAKNNNFSNSNIRQINERIFDLHSSGCKIFLTLKTTKGRLLNNNSLSISSSFNNEFFNANNTCLPILDSGLKNIANHFAIETSHAKKAGFDGVLIDGSLSNLLGEMTSEEFNRREFGYYSDIFDLPKKILEKINQNVENMPILYKISPFSFFYECFLDNKIQSLKRVKFMAQSKKIFDFLCHLVMIGVDGFVVEFGSIENQFLSEFAPYLGHELFVDFFNSLEKYFKDSKLKNKFRESPLIICCDNFDNFGASYKTGNRMFDITKFLYSDLDYIKNYATKTPTKKCLRCGICKKTAIEQHKVWCTINPELIYGKPKFNKFETKKVAVIGAGTSGIVVSNNLAKRGLMVDLFDKETAINKNGRLCEVFGSDEYLKNFNEYIENELKTLSKTDNLSLKLSETFEIKNLKNYDAIVIATGFKELFLGVPGSILRSVVSIFDILSKKFSYENKKNIVVYARSELAFKLALFMARHKHKVSVLISNETFLKNIPQNLLSYYLFAFKKQGINVHPCCQVKNINEDSVDIFINHKTRHLDFVSLIMNIRSGVSYKFLPEAKVVDCNLFVYDPELIPNNKLFYEIAKSGYKGELYMVGDALQISDLCDEIKSAYFVGNNI